VNVALVFLQRYWRPIALVVMVLAAILAVYGKGRNDEREVWKARMAAAKIAAAEETRALLEKNHALELKAAKVIERERVVTKTIVERVDREVPVNACPIDGSYRVLHDAAARGEYSPAAGRSNAPAVAVKDAARTVVENYGACREDQERLIALQQWARDVANHPVVCPCN
jgi:hypothetical protein